MRKLTIYARTQPTHGFLISGSVEKITINYNEKWGGRAERVKSKLDLFFPNRAIPVVITGW